MINKLIHRHLKSIAAIRGISQAEIARQLSQKYDMPISRALVNQVFRGFTHPKYLREGIAEILGFSPEEIWGEETGRLNRRGRPNRQGNPLILPEL